MSRGWTVSLLAQGRVSAAALALGSHGASCHHPDWSRASQVLVGEGTTLLRLDSVSYWEQSQLCWGGGGNCHLNPALLCSALLSALLSQPCPSDVVPFHTWTQLTLLPVGSGAGSKQRQWHGSFPCLDPAGSSPAESRAGQWKRWWKAQQAHCHLGCWKTSTSEEKLQGMATN